MTFEQYKIELRKNLVDLVGEKRADKYMEMYKDDLQDIFNDDWSIPGITAAIIWNFY